MRDLFAPSPEENLLPRDGTMRYFGPVLGEAEAGRYAAVLRETLPWRHDEVVLYGKQLVTGRKVAWYGDAEYEYRYSGTTKRALLWTPELLELKALAETQCGHRFNSCLLNLYRDGSEGMGWHSDDEKTLGPETTIASLSLGAERRFLCRHKRDHALRLELTLENGSLLVMAGAMQAHWQHAVPKTTRVREPRVNLTFRTIRQPLRVASA